MIQAMGVARLLREGEELRGQRHPHTVVVLLTVAQAVANGLCIELIQNLLTAIQNLVRLVCHCGDACPRDCGRLGCAPELLADSVRAAQEVLINGQKRIESVRCVDDGFVVPCFAVTDPREEDIDIPNRNIADGGTPRGL